MNVKRMKEKSWNYFKATLFFVVTAFLSVYIILEMFLPDQTVKLVGFKPYVVMTQSMEPAINANDLVVVKDIEVDRLEVGDIITFKTDINYDGTKEVVTHYVYEIIQDNNGDYSFKTNPHYESTEEVIPDTWVLLEEDLLGEYMFHIPMIGSIILFLKSPFGIGAMIFNVGIIIAIFLLIKQGKKKQQENKN